MIRFIHARNRLVARILALSAAAGLLGSAASRGAESRAFVAATDFGTGSLANIAFGPPRTVTPNAASTSPDAVLRWFGGLLYVVNRSGASNIQVLDPANNFALVHQTSVGSGANPHDIQPVSATKAYVTRYDTADLWIINPQTGQFLGSISLAAFADADGIPEMDHLALRNGRLFVSIERLDRNNFYAPAGGSQVVVIDVATNAIVDVDPGTPGVQGILLPYQDPITEMVVDPNGQIVVGCVGNFGVFDGGIVRIDPVSLTVAATEITEAALAGDINDVAVLNAERGFAVVADASFNTALRAYRRDLGTVQSTLISSSGYFLADCEVNDRTELWVCDRDFSNPGVRVFDAVTYVELTPTRLNTGPPPQDIAFDGSSTVDVPIRSSESGGVSMTIAAISPNPSPGAVEILFSLGESAAGSGASTVSARIVDVAGRTIRTMSVPATGAGRHSLVWDGMRADGCPAETGVYFVELRSGGMAARGRLVRIR